MEGEAREKGFHNAEYEAKRLESFQRALNKPRLTFGICNIHVQHH